MHHGPAGDPTLNPSVQGISSNSTEQHAAEKLSYSKLHSVNPDVEGWVTIPDSNVDYPVLRTPAGSPDFQSAEKNGGLSFLRQNFERLNCIIIGLQII